MTKVIFVLLANLANGDQIELSRSAPMDEAACLPKQAAIWNQEWPQTPEGWNVVDAACVPVN